MSRRRIALGLLAAVLLGACAASRLADREEVLRRERGWIIRSEPAMSRDVVAPPDAGPAAD